MDLKEKMIGGITENRTLRHHRFECHLLLTGSELSRYLPCPGDPAPWAAENAVITGITRTYLAEDTWSLRLQAELPDKNHIQLNTGKTGSELERTVLQSFDVGSVYFPPDWFGCRVATAKDCTQFNDDGEEILTGGKTKYLNLHGEWAKPGEFIAINAIPLYFSPDSGKLVREATAGSMDFSRSPFRDAIPEAFLGQTITTRLYRCVFFSRKEMHRFNSFSGINGKFGNRCSPGTTQEGCWLAKSQQVKYAADLSGTVYSRVERIMLEAPGGLHWDEERNGGIWQW